MLKKYYPGTIVDDSKLGPLQFMADVTVQVQDRELDIIEVENIDLKAFRKNPVMLWQHKADNVIGRWPSIWAQSTSLRALGEFAAEGASQLADQTRKLLKGSAINAVSIGFNPIKREPIKGGGYRYTAVELCEISLVAVPANPLALVTARSFGKSGRVLSGANATKLQQAHDAAESCRALVADVLGSNSNDPDDSDDPGAKARRQRDLDIININTPPPLTRAERMAVAREIEIWSLRNAP
jgi:HK97 family phage prohead protease